MYGVVEIMGHRTRAGMLSDATIGGATMLRIEHPTRAMADNPSEPACEYYSPQAIFAIRPCSQDEATAVANWAWPDQPTTPALNPSLDEYGDDWDVPDDEPDDAA